ncbi:single-stranded DNA-binding protein [Candidatus Gracilibacteria bacterium]|nr:single-stranded DNA-binding protein [Candidatus Gracilibacteria bacterium]
MARDLNRVMIIGRLGVDPELRYTPSGSPVATFRVASSRQWKDAHGETREETEWFSVVAWNKLAEICQQYLAKGSRVYVEGRLQTRSWDDQQSGQTRSRTEIVISDMIILDGRNTRENADSDYEPPRDTPRSPQRGGYTPPDIGDEDIPFGHCGRVRFVVASYRWSPPLLCIACMAYGGRPFFMPLGRRHRKNRRKGGRPRRRTRRARAGLLQLR